MRSLIIRFFILLGLFFPVLASASAAASFSIASGWAGAGAAFDGTNFLVALESDTSTAKVAAQLVSSSGAKIGSTIPLGHDGQSCCAAGMAFDGSNYLVAWEEDQGIKNSWTPLMVYGRFINTSGATVGQAFAMTSAGISLDGLNMLAYGGGKYLLTYTRLINPANGDASTNRYVAGRIISPDGSMGNEFRISTGYGNGSSVTFNGANGENFFVVWKEDSNDYEVRGRFVSPAGVPLGEISINASQAPSDNPVAVAFDGTNYMVVFNDEVGATPTSPTHAWDVLGQRVSVNDGSLVGGVITISNDPGAQVAMSVAFDGANHLVTWVDAKNDANHNNTCDTGEGTCWDVYGQYVGKDGALVGSKFAINTDAGNQMGGVGCFSGKCLALVSSGIVMGRGGPAQVGEVYGTFLTSTPPPSDTQAPTVPANVTATANSATQVTVGWSAASDNIGVTYYQVYRNGSPAGTPAGPNNNFWPDTFVIGNTTYNYTVAACDAAGNCSAQSGAVSATTPAGTLYTLSVAKSGTGSGTVTSSPAGINCGSTCSGSFTGGASVTLTTTPASGSYFAGWNGDCTGTGACTVSINAAKNVTATFNPFTVVTTGVTAGIITAPVATVTTTISVNAADVGQTRSVFITAMMPQSAIGTTLAMTGSASRTMALAAPAASSLVLMNLTSTGWQPVVNGQLIPYTTGVLSAQLAAITILNNASTASLGGSQFCVGYGTSVTEMNSAGRMQLIATIPDPNAASAATGSCILISDARAFAYAEANFPSIFAGSPTAGQATYQDNQYDYRYYPVSGNYLGVDPSGMVYLLGPYTGSALTHVGQVESFRSVITAWEAAP